MVSEDSLIPDDSPWLSTKEQDRSCLLIPEGTSVVAALCDEHNGSSTSPIRRSNGRNQPSSGPFLLIFRTPDIVTPAMFQAVS